jgi:hypothetical protein
LSFPAVQARLESFRCARPRPFKSPPAKLLKISFQFSAFSFLRQQAINPGFSKKKLKAVS